MTDVLREILLPELQNVKKTGAGFMARCPAHDDGKASLSLSYGQQQPVVLKCHAGCDSDTILAELGLSWKDLSKPREPKPDGEWTPAGPAVAVYDYRDEQGELLFQVCRTAGKEFRQRRPDPSKPGKYVWRLENTRRVLYKLPKVIEAVEQGRQVWIVEGEKDVHTLEALGLTATCNPGGAGKWLDDYTPVLKEAVVAICADADEPGRAHARRVFDALDGVAAAIEVFEAPDHKDITDHLGAGRTLDELVRTKTTENTANPVLAPDLWEFIGVPDSPFDWLVPDVLERGDRMIITGAEGLGKSTWARQLAVMLAAGIHPVLHHERIAPVRVLVIDCENSEKQNRRAYRPLAACSVKSNSRVPDGGLRLIHRPEGIDLTRGPDAAWLIERVAAHEPDVLFIGPFYRLHNANINDEQPARSCVEVLDRARTLGAGCALFTEAHAGHAQQGNARALRPAGSSLLLRWPEFGFGLRAADGTRYSDNGRPMDVEVVGWRGARENRNWPGNLKHGMEGEWPWAPSFGPPQPRQTGDLSAAALTKKLNSKGDTQ